MLRDPTRNVICEPANYNEWVITCEQRGRGAQNFGPTGPNRERLNRQAKKKSKSVEAEVKVYFPASRAGQTIESVKRDREAAKNSLAAGRQTVNHEAEANGTNHNISWCATQRTSSMIIPGASLR